jgi:hypothetical protein
MVSKYWDLYKVHLLGWCHPSLTPVISEVESLGTDVESDRVAVIRNGRRDMELRVQENC